MWVPKTTHSTFLLAAKNILTLSGTPDGKSRLLSSQWGQRTHYGILVLSSCFFPRSLHSRVGTGWECATKQKVHSTQGNMPQRWWDVLQNATARRALTAHLIQANFTGTKRSPEKKKLIQSGQIINPLLWFSNHNKTKYRKKQNIKSMHTTLSSLPPTKNMYLL